MTQRYNYKYKRFELGIKQQTFQAFNLLVHDPHTLSLPPALAGESITLTPGGRRLGSQR
jgi:hypothetical protein